MLMVLNNVTNDKEIVVNATDLFHDILYVLRIYIINQAKLINVYNETLPRTANLEAQYGTRLVRPRTPAIDETAITWPWLFLIIFGKNVSNICKEKKNLCKTLADFLLIKCVYT